jgi:hypothetical protein
LSDVIAFHDKRFTIGFTAREKAGLLAFLKDPVTGGSHALKRIREGVAAQAN